MTGPLNSSKPSSALCRKVKCRHLLPDEIETAKGPRTSWYCDLSKRVPGNMSVCPLDAPDAEMKVLSMRQPFASMAAMEIMVLNIRSTDCHYRGPVAIYATRGNVRRKDRKYFEEVLGRDISSLPHGRILCVAEIAGTIYFDNPEKFAAYSECHYLSPFFFEEGMCVYGWVLQNIRPLRYEVGFKMPKGCVNWSRIRTSVIDQCLPVTEGMIA